VPAPQGVAMRPQLNPVTASVWLKMHLSRSWIVIFMFRGNFLSTLAIWNLQHAVSKIAGLLGFTFMHNNMHLVGSREHDDFIL
jgi:hypothetical protein